MIDIELTDINLQNSILIKSKQFHIYNLQVTNIQLTASQLLVSQQKLQNIPLAISLLTQVVLQNNQVLSLPSDFSGIIDISQPSGTVNFTNITLRNNKCLGCKLIEENEAQNADRLFVIRAQQFFGKNITIQKWSGLTEISIQQSLLSKFEDLVIYSTTALNIQTQYADCLPQQAVQITNSVIKLTNIKSIQFTNCKISGNLMINSPIIYILLEASMGNGQILQFQDSVFINNTFVKSNSIAYTSVIYIQSEVSQTISMNKLLFNTNWLNVYQEGASNTQSATIIRIHSPESSIFLTNSEFYNILITNSSQSNIYISASQISIEDCQFNQINMFQWQIYQQFIRFNLNQKNEMYLEQMMAIFTIQSIGGIAYLNFDNLLINNISVNSSQAAEVGTFYLLTKKIGVIQISNSIIKNSRTTAIDTNSIGGCLIISSKQHTLNLKYINNQIYNSSSYSNGGFLIIYPALINNKLEFIDSLFQNIYSLGTILVNCIFYNAITQQQNDLMNLQNISVINSAVGFQQYLSEIPLFTNVDINSLTNSRTLISVVGGSILIRKCQFTNIDMWGIFSLLKASSIVFDQLLIQNCSYLATPLIEIELAQQSGQVKLFGLQIVNIEQSKTNSLFQCNSIKLLPQQELRCKSDSITPNQLLQYFDREYYQQIMQCNFIYLFQQEISIESLFTLTNIKTNRTVSLNNMQLQNVICAQCSMGLLQISGSTSFQMLFSDSIIKNNNCGDLGCIVLAGQEVNDKKLITNITQDIRVSTVVHRNLLAQSNVLMISNVLFTGNSANYGTCLTIIGLMVQIDYLRCINSIAKISSAVHFVGNQTTMTLNNSVLSNNQGLGDLFLKNYQLTNNSNYGQLRIIELPSKMSCSIDGQQSILDTKQQDNMTVVIPGTFQIYNGSFSDILMIPSGQPLVNYKIFDRNLNTLIDYNRTLRIVALSQQMEIQRNLVGSQCILNQAIFDRRDNSITNQIQTTIHFNELTGDYSLDDYIIKFDPQNPKEMVVQLNLQCNSIKPINATEYNLVIHLQTYQCQLGEMYFIGECLQCNSKLNQYSVNPTKNVCDIKNSITTEDITSATLKLKPSYWRYTYDNDQIVQCVNKEDNCIGGWISGNPSCAVGYIGCQCESCDLYNIRGSGNYYTREQFSCQKCSEQAASIILIIVLTILLVFIMTILTVNSQFMINEQIQRLKAETSQYKIVHKLTQDQSGALIKLFSNFLLIISSILSDAKDISYSTILPFQVLSNSTEIISYSFDCLFNSSSLNILYFRLVWQMLLPFIYYAFILLLFLILFRQKFAKQKMIVIATTLIYLLMIAQPNIIKETTYLLSYRNISGHKWILRDVAYKYDSQDHQQYLFGLLLPTIIMYGAMWPATMYYLLWRNKTKLYDMFTRCLLGYLYNEYKQQSYYWEIIKIIYKALIITVIAYFQDSSQVKFYLTETIIIIYFIFLHSIKPYNQIRLNRLESMILTCQLEIILIIWVLPNSQEFWGMYTVLFIILITLIIYVLISILSELIKVIGRKYQSYFDLFKRALIRLFPNATKYKIVAKLFILNDDKKQLIYYRFKQIRLYLNQQVRMASANFKNERNRQMIQTVPDELIQQEQQLIAAQSY